MKNYENYIFKKLGFVKIKIKFHMTILFLTYDSKLPKIKLKGNSITTLMQQVYH